MKQLILSFFVFFLFSYSFAQITYQGTVVKKFYSAKAGDTVIVLGPLVPGEETFFQRYDMPSTHYYVKLKSGVYRTVPKEKIILEEKDLDFWANKWFKYRGFLRIKTGWNPGARRKLLANAVAKKELLNPFVDPYLQDYLEGLVNQLHPDTLVRKNSSRIHVHLVDSKEKAISTHNNGLIIISTGKLVQLKSEAALIRLLATQIAHIVIEHELVNQQSVNYYAENANNFTKTQKSLASFIAQEFFEKNKKSANPIFLDQNQDAYVMKISRVITDAAWKAWHSQEYTSALEMVDRLITAHIATDETYILKAMLYRQLYYTEQSNLAALGYLEKAEKLKVHNDIAVNRERGLLFLRLNRVKEAKEAFEKYLEEMLNSGDYGEDFKWTKDMIFKCDRMLLGLNQPTTSVKP